MDVVLFDKICWQVADFHSHIFATFHWRVEIEIFDVNGHELGAWGGDDGIDKELDHEEVDCWSAASTGVDYEVPANS